MVRPHSSFVSATMMPRVAAYAAPRRNTSRLWLRSRLAASVPMRSAIQSNETFSSCPESALVAGVKMGSGNCDPAASPAGSLTPQIDPLRRYSVSADPAIQPRTTHSNGMTSVPCTSMERPRSDSRSKPAGKHAAANSLMASMSVVMRWCAMGSGPVDSQSNQNAEMAVSTRPLSGIGVGSTQSKALIRSVLTMSKCLSNR